MLTAFLFTLLLIIPNNWLGWSLHGWWAAMVASVVCYVVALAADYSFPRKVETADA